MSISRQVLITCNQTGEELVVRDGAKHPVDPDWNGYVREVSLSSGGGLRSAAEYAYKLGWSSHSLRSVDGYFSSFRAVPPGRGNRAYYLEWWTAPGVEPDPPFSKTAKLQLEARSRREESAAGLDEQIARLASEIDRLRQLQDRAVA